MADLQNPRLPTTTTAAIAGDLTRARELYLAGGKDSDRQATELLLRAFEASKGAADRVPLDQIDSLSRLVHLLATQGQGELAGRWASTLYSSIMGKEEWLKNATLEDAYVWASKGLAMAGRFVEALNVEDRFIQSVARRLARPSLAVTQSWFRSAVYHYHEGHTTRALIIATKASDIGWRELRGSKEDAQMLAELLLCVKKLQEIEGAPQQAILRTRRKLTETMRLLHES